MHVSCKSILTYSVNTYLTIGAIAISGSYSYSQIPIHINDLNCSGSEEEVGHCPHNTLVLSQCYPASVVCQAPYSKVHYSKYA